jgi:hypothetical protein
MRRLMWVFVLVLAGVLAAGSAQAVNFGTNVTIPDGVSSGGSGTGSEDNEVEPNCVKAQLWDLEGFFFDNNTGTLTAVGGFDFVNGQASGRNDPTRFFIGDVFIDSAANGKGYDYAVVMNLSNKTYNVYALNQTSQFVNSYFSQNAASDPFALKLTNEQLVGSGNLLYDIYNSDILGLSSDFYAKNQLFLHNSVSLVGLSQLLSTYTGGALTVHLTEGCGNDNMMGQFKVPEPSTVLLLGPALIFIGLRRTRRQQA